MTLDEQLKNENVEQFLRLLQHPEVQEAFESIVINLLHNCNFFEKFKSIGEFLGENETHCIGRDIDYEKGISMYDEEREPLKRFPDQLSEITDKLKDVKSQAETKILSGNVTEIRARMIFENLKTVDFRQGKRFSLSTEVRDFLLLKIPDEYRTTEKGAKQASKDVMEKALELYPNQLKIGKTRKNVRYIELIENIEY
jgi:hypothetical protein